MTPSDNTEFLFRCDICNMYTKDEAELLEHKTMKHSDNTVEAQRIYEFVQLCARQGIAISYTEKFIHSLTTQARIEELENLTEQYGVFRDETMGEPITLKAVTLYRIKHRINTLKGQL